MKLILTGFYTIYDDRSHMLSNTTKQLNDSHFQFLLSVECIKAIASVPSLNSVFIACDLYYTPHKKWTTKHVNKLSKNSDRTQVNFHLTSLWPPKSEHYG